MVGLWRVVVCVAWLTCLAAQQQNIKVHITTWNVNSQNPPENMDKLVGKVVNGDLPDIVVLGLQEVTMNPKQALLDYLFHDKWSLKLEQVLSGEYTKIKTKVMVSVALIIYVRNYHANSIKEIDSFQVPTGFGGIYGNKGAVVISFRMYGNRFSFVNCHLPAHDGAAASRIADFNTIEARRVKESRMKEDFLFWFGDMNFRIDDPSLDADKIKSMIKKGQLSQLLENDELTQLMASGQILRGWTEAPITFNPTYKVLIGNGDYNVKRRPAWTDRILYTSENDREIVITAYDSVEGFLESDHKPVMAEFQVTL